MLRFIILGGFVMLEVVLISCVCGVIDGNV